MRYLRRFFRETDMGLFKGFAAILIAALLPLSAQAQTGSETLIRDMMAKGGITSGVSYNTSYGKAFDGQAIFDNAMAKAYGKAEDREVRWDGLRTSTTFATAEETWMLMTVMENHTDQPYCFRMRFLFDTMPDYSKGALSRGNYLLPPHSSQPVLVMANTGRSKFSYRPLFAYWHPAESAPDGKRCSAVAPSGLDEWASAPERAGELVEFNESRR